MPQIPTTRSRWINSSFGTGILKGRALFPDGTMHALAGSVHDWGNLPKGKQTTVSEGHPFRSRSKGSKADLGGDFFTERTFVVNPGKASTTMNVVRFGGASERSYTGPITPLDPKPLSFPPSIKSSNAQLDAAGATAVARCKPTNSIANVATFLGETLKDGLPHAVGSTTWKSRTLNARNAGHEFLNVEFGWLPLLSDVRSFGQAVTHANTVLKQYERDAGKVVRRQYGFPVERTESEEQIDVPNECFFEPYDSQLGGGPRGPCMRKVETSRRKWFSGAFTYHLPLGSDNRSKMIRYALEADKLFGTTPTPETLWNLAPWSWAIDWFSNAGDVVSNISDWIVDGLVMQYGYVMEHTITKHTYTRSPTGLFDQNVSVRPLTLVTETKIRRRANPFGFGVTWEGLSPIQALIAAAIGLTR